MSKDTHDSVSYLLEVQADGARATPIPESFWDRVLGKELTDEIKSRLSTGEPMTYLQSYKNARLYDELVATISLAGVAEPHKVELLAIIDEHNIHSTECMKKVRNMQDDGIARIDLYASLRKIQARSDAFSSYPDTTDSPGGVHNMSTSKDTQGDEEVVSMSRYTSEGKLTCCICSNEYVEYAVGSMMLTGLVFRSAYSQSVTYDVCPACSVHYFK